MGNIWTSDELEMNVGLLMFAGYPIYNSVTRPSSSPILTSQSGGCGETVSLPLDVLRQHLAQAAKQVGGTQFWSSKMEMFCQQDCSNCQN